MGFTVQHTKETKPAFLELRSEIAENHSCVTNINIVLFYYPVNLKFRGNFMVGEYYYPSLANGKTTTQKG